MKILFSELPLILVASLVLLSSQVLMAQNETVTCQGRVLRRDGGRLFPMAAGRVGASDERGQMYESAAIQPDGTYELNLRANQRSVVQVLLREYNFDPAKSVFFPGQNRQIPDFIATPKVAGALEVIVKPHPRATSTAKLNNERFTVTDADTGRLISTFRLDRQGRFRVNAMEGTKILIEPKPNQGLQWIPPRFETTITRQSEMTEFTYIFSSEVGTGNLNLSKDRTRFPSTFDVSLGLVDLNRGKLIAGDLVELCATSGRGVPEGCVYSFLIRYDDERNFRTLANNQPGTTVRLTLDRPGGFEAKVALILNGVILGGTAIRSYVLASPNDKAPGVKLHERGSKGFIDDLPQDWHMDLRFTIDQIAGPVRQPRKLKLDAWAKSDMNSHRVPREGRRLTFLMRHEDDREWTVVTQNVPTLEWSWIPQRQGKWTLRVDYVKNENKPHSGENGRAQISFTATGLSTVNTSSSGLAAETPPPPRPGFRPFATPTPRPNVRPVPIATPTPRQTFQPIPRFTPSAQATPVKKAPVFLRPRATPAA